MNLMESFVSNFSSRNIVSYLLCNRHRNCDKASIKLSFPSCTSFSFVEVAETDRQ